MSRAHHEFHSPSTLLHEWRDRPDGARLREVLITGYTHDLVFLERHCVPTARGLGARVTILGDAAQAVHDPVDVRYAGRTYQHGFAACEGAFHPKLVVLVGDEDVWAAIGSGNPTMSGWGHNRELWLVLRTSRRRGPAAQRDLAAWLVELPEVVAMPSWIADAVLRTGEHVDPDEVDDSVPGLRIFGNLRQPLLSRLPTASVEALRVSSPFFDPQAAALRALVRRLSPAAVDIALQPRLTQYDAASIVSATAAAGTTRYRLLDEDRTRHGKLVEWSSGGTTTALVGSANCTAAGLLTATDAGGNCELVASLPIPVSLMPEGTTTTAPPASTHPVPTSPGRAVVLVLLGARRQDDHLVVELKTTAREPVTIESSPDGTPGTWTAFHTWHPTGPLPAVLRFPAPEQLGSAVRAWVEVRGERVVSSEVYLTDPVRCLPRGDEHDRPRLVRDYELDSTFTDPALAARFNADLVRLLSQVSRERVTGAPALRAHPHGVAAVAPEDRWGVWLQHVEATIGPSLTGLVFPSSPQLPDGRVTAWAVGPDPDDTELADDEDESVVEATASQEPNNRVIPPSERGKLRTWAARWVKAVSGPIRPPLELRMTVTLLYLDLLAAGVWGAEDGWRTEVRDLVHALVPDDDEADDVPGRAISYQYSLTAVCLALLFQGATLHGGGERDVIARAAWEAGRESAAFADRRLTTEYLHEATQPHARVVTESEVENVIALAEAVVDDPHAEVRAAFEQAGLSVRLVDGVWVRDGDFRNPRRAAAEVATIAGKRSAVLARNAAKAVVLLHDGTTLVLAESTAPRWRVYRLSPLSTPSLLLGGADGLPTASSQHPLDPSPPEVVHLADRLRVDLAHLVAAVRTS
ncbi:phospholipase D-like domain-containing protein [Saccharothrix variisporea]|uniref:Uncharacterized protein n=1 Tax=Saccharothrix variisporea TaxID=543527 RepID=A0A495XJY8_9PSEU|nr:hypothetical protein [Saccharothrix variisporea]RKT74750.1 hypothetical protein DFJ66_8119 [Saccharothrix variisporea]